MKYEKVYFIIFSYIWNISLLIVSSPIRVIDFMAGVVETVNTLFLLRHKEG